MSPRGTVALHIKRVDLDATLALWPTVAPLAHGQEGARVQRSLLAKLTAARSEQSELAANSRQHVVIAREELELLMVLSSMVAARYAIAGDATAGERWFLLTNELRAAWELVQPRAVNAARGEARGAMRRRPRVHRDAPHARAITERRAGPTFTAPVE